LVRPEEVFRRDSLSPFFILREKPGKKKQTFTANFEEKKEEKLCDARGNIMDFF
jgi:hypothetical protein